MQFYSYTDGNARHMSMTDRKAFCQDFHLTYSALFCITETCLYNFDPLKPHFYIVKNSGLQGYIYISYFCSKT